MSPEWFVSKTNSTNTDSAPLTLEVLQQAIDSISERTAKPIPWEPITRIVSPEEYARILESSYSLVMKCPRPHRWCCPCPHCDCYRNRSFCCWCDTYDF